MFERLSKDARRQVLTSATEEMMRRGDRRLGTDHLLLGLLSDPAGLPVQVLGVDLNTARAAADALDRKALASIGLEVADYHPAVAPRGRRIARFTSGARAALKRSLEITVRGRSRYIETRHLLMGLLLCEQPDPAAALLEAMGVDRAAALSGLAS